MHSTRACTNYAYNIRVHTLSYIPMMYELVLDSNRKYAYFVRNLLQILSVLSHTDTHSVGAG